MMRVQREEVTLSVAQVKALLERQGIDMEPEDVPQDLLGYLYAISSEVLRRRAARKGVPHVLVKADEGRGREYARHTWAERKA